MPPPGKPEPARVERRPANEGDREFLETLDRQVLGTYAMRQFGWDDQELRTRIRQDIRPELRELILVDGRPVGSLWIEDLGTALVIDHIALAPEAQGRGIGTSIIRRVQAQATSTGVGVRLSVLRVNPARAFYERLGFRVVAEDDHRLTMQWM
jgi:ribosomal protein S18 acetylase RimI-like enzyme